MLEIRVTVADADGARGLLHRLGALFDRSSVSFDDSRSEVRIASKRQSRSVVEVIDVVQAWLTADDVDSARVSVGDRSYMLVGPSYAGVSPGESG